MKPLPLALSLSCCMNPLPLTSLHCTAGGTGAGSVGVGGDFRSPRSAFSTTSSQAGSDSGGGA